MMNVMNVPGPHRMNPPCDDRIAGDCDVDDHSSPDFDFLDCETNNSRVLSFASSFLLSVCFHSALCQPHYLGPLLPPRFFFSGFELPSLSVSSGLYYLSLLLLLLLSSTVPGSSSKTSVSKKAGTVNGPWPLGLFTRALTLN